MLSNLKFPSNKSTEFNSKVYYLQNGIFSLVVTLCSVLAPSSEWLMNSQKPVACEHF